MSKLSLYADSLPPDAKARYLDRIESIDGPDIRSHLTSLETRCDLISYLVLQTSFITRKQFKAYKSLGAYNQLNCL